MNSYQPIQHFILRTPLLPTNSVKQLVSNNITKESLRQMCSDRAVIEALFLASPSFYKEVLKWLECKMPNEKEDNKVMQGLYRYFARMCNRCTPFGMFAGIATGTISDKTDIFLSPKEKNKLHVRLDMNYVCALAKDLAEIPEIKEQILFYPNNSLYRIGDKMRYVEYTFKNAMRSHHISAVDASEYLLKVVNEAKQGKRLIDLAEAVVDDEVTFNDAKDFIEEMVAAQVLTSELEPTVIGIDPLEQMITVLDKYPDNTVVSDIKRKLESINDSLKKIRDKADNSESNLNQYENIKKQLSEFSTTYDEKFLFQADMLLKPAVNTASSSISDSIFKTIKFLNRITPYFENENLRNFKEAFYSRYEEEEVPLAQALDTESGIGYLQNTYNGITPLVDDVFFPPMIQNYQNSITLPHHVVMQQKLSEALTCHKKEICIDESDFEGFEAKWDDTPETISAFVQLIDSRHFYVRSIGGSCAANLIGRFCHLDNSIFEHTKEIILKDEAEKDRIYAEIVHLPESRIGNILHRPTIRNYEIPYLAQSSLPIDNQLPLDDLMVSVRDNRILLRSKKHNKLVIPRLTTAHNFSYNALPVYQFLCDMQNCDKRGGFGFSWGSIENTMPYLPRVVYGDAILSLETWNFFKKDIDILNKIKDKDERIDKFMEMVKKRNITDEVILEDNDNELYLNLTNRFCVAVLLELIKKRYSFTLKEFPFSNDKIPVKASDECFANEMLFAYYKNTEKQ